MKKLDALVKRVEQFERLAVYGDRKSFLNRLAQENMSKEPNYSAMLPNKSVDPNAPAPSDVMNMPEDHITGYRPIDKNVQTMLNKLLVPPGYYLPIAEDGKMGPETQKALSIFKSKFSKPASVAAITEEFNKSKNPSAVATTSKPSDSLTFNPNSGAPVAPMKFNTPPVNTKSTADSSSGKQTEVTPPKV